jgi:cytochrome P450
VISANANAIVTAVWFIFYVNKDAELKRRVEAEMSTAINNLSSTIPVQFNIQKLTNGSLLQSIYAETLRLHVAVQLNRTPEHSDYMLGPWRMRQGRMITLNTLITGQLTSLWSQGGVENSHPLTEFWSDRFLVYPDDPSSGPLKSSADKSREGGFEEKTIDIAKRPSPTFTTEGLAGGFVPYGGGPWMCPGRHFAKQEMIGSFALFSHYFDIAIDPEDAKKVEADMSFFGLGSLPLKEKLPFKIRRKSGV